MAIAAGERALARDARDARAAALLNEGLLCRGLRDDDPWALAAAGRGFEKELSSGKSGFYHQLYLIEALRTRFPLSDALLSDLTRAEEALSAADVGAARPQLAIHLAEQRRAVEEHRAQFLPLLRQRTAERERGTLTREHLIELLLLLGQTGPTGIDRALAVLDAEAYRAADVGLATLYRAELLRGVASPAFEDALYSTAEQALCSGGSADETGECAQARRRLAQLQLLETAQGGSP